MERKKAFTLVELLVAMAVIAILLGLAVFGITVVQQNARDTQRRTMVNDIEIALNSQIAAGQALPSNFPGNETTSITIGGSTITLNAPLTRPATDGAATLDTTSSVTDYCYGVSGNSYVVGVDLEAGGLFFKTNTGGTYSNFDTNPTGGTAPTLQCTDENL